jgi:2-methylcitrate dehydratase PrpD
LTDAGHRLQTIRWPRLLTRLTQEENNVAAYPATERIARFVDETTLDAVPPAAVDTAKAAFMDCLGVALAGSQDDAGSLAARAAREEGAREEAGVLGHGFRTSAQQAAFANGVAAHALDYDHGLSTGGQPTAPIIPAALAMAEALGTSGSRLLEAYVVGFEVTAKIAQSLYATPQYAWHAPSTMGVLGATAACAKLLALSEDQTRNALGVAVSMAGGVEANFGTMTKPLHVGHAARSAVLAAKLAASGFTANRQAIEAEVGYYDAYYRTTPGDESPLEGLGTSWELVDSGLRIKPYPCGGLAHTAIDAALLLRAEHLSALGSRGEEIESVGVEVTQRTLDRIVFGIPRTELEAKFSMPYLLGRALVEGGVGLDAFTDDAIQERNVLTVAEKVRMSLGPDLKASKAGRPARVTIRLRDGRTLSRRVDAAKGGDVVPMTGDELRGKFLECAVRAITPASADLLVEAIQGLDSTADLRALSALLSGEAA